MTEGIAVIGMACRFPGAQDTDVFWANLKNGVESITCFSDQELEEAGIPYEVYNQPEYVKKGFIIDDEDMFDASFFGYSPREAENMDPQHRLFLETAWKALEDGGYPPCEYDGSIGVFAGSKISTYLLNLINDRQSMHGAVSGYQTLIGNDKDYLVTRASYKLNLKGPSVTIQSACSTSLVAVHFACESLLSGACDMALAGGVSISTPQKTGYLYQEGMVFSPDGHCRAFDKQAKGMSPGNGVGIVLLKDLGKALQEKDHIYAVIRGTAVNNDGSNKTGFTSPSIEGQSKVIREAISVAGIDCESISYIETHGTGTELGDPIEIEALNEAFKAETSKKGFCAIGSVKTNIGHLDTSAGIASLIKTVLSLQHGQIPPSLNFLGPNPKIDFQSTPFFVNTKLSEWKTNGAPRRAGVSAFGFGGTNAHVVLEQAPQHLSEKGNHAHPLHLLTLSAKTKEALKQQIRNYDLFLDNNKKLSIEEVCFTANTGRPHFQYRLAVIAASIDDLKRQLFAAAAGETSSTLFEGVAYSQIESEVSFDRSRRSSLETDRFQDIVSDVHELSAHYRLPLPWTDKENYRLILTAVAMLYIRGAAVDWLGLYDEGHPHRPPYRVPLPTYPFERKRHWKAALSRLLSKRIWDQLRLETDGKASAFNDLKIQHKNIEKLCILYFGLAFQHIGAFCEKELTVDELIENFNIPPEHHQLILRLLDTLVKYNRLKRINNKYQMLQPVSIQEIKKITSAIKKTAGFSDTTKELIKLIQACGENFGNVLLGKKNHREIVFPEGSIEVIEKLYVNSPSAVFLNSIVRKTLSQIISIVPSDYNVRILEIGAGTGATTRSVLPALGHQCIYTFTDISSSFLNKAERRFQEYPFIRYKVLDIGKPISPQGFQMGSFDVIIASNVLHATKNMDRTISHINDLLAPGGILVIREITRQMSQFEIIFGPLLTELEDEDKRDANPFLSVKSWKQLLEKHNFIESQIFPDASDLNKNLKEHIIIARVNDQPETIDRQLAFTYTNELAQQNLQPPKKNAVDCHPLLGTVFFSPISGITFENKIRLSGLLPSLRNHRILGEIVAPAGYFFEIALAAGREIFGTHAVVLKNVLLHEALIFESTDHPIKLQTIITPGDPANFAFEIYSTPEAAPIDRSNWKMHFSGNIEKDVATSLSWDKSFDKIQQRCTQQIEIKNLYTPGTRKGNVSTTGINLRDLTCGEHEAIGRIDFSENTLTEAIEYRMPPAFLDACLQVWTAILDTTFEDNDRTIPYLPVAIEHIRYHVNASKQLWCHVEAHELNDKNNLKGNIRLFSMTGETIAEIIGMQMRPVTPQVIWSNRHKKLNYELNWQIYPEHEKESAPNISLNGCWLLLADKSGFSQQLSEEIIKTQDTKQSIFAEDNQKYPEVWTEQNFTQVFNAKIVSKHIRCKGIVYMWALDVPESNALTLDTVKHLTRYHYLNILHLIRSIISTGLKIQRLCIVTRNAHFTSLNDHNVNPIHSVLWGLRRVIAHEHPEFKSICIDLGSCILENEGKKVLEQLQLNDDENEIALRDTQKFVSRLVRAIPLKRNGSVKSQTLFKSDATYIITGGFGGMGLETARWLSENGVRNIVLMGRSTPSPMALETIEEIRKAGAIVRTKQVDIGNQKALSKIFNELKASMPPLKGVFHLAGVLREGGILGQSSSDMELVMTPKIEGAWHLHLLTWDVPLDHFVLFSSISSLWGGHGLGAYTASNAFLDMLASHRKTLGLPALSVNWGAFSQIGMLAQDDAGTQIRAKAGIGSFDPQEALSHLLIAMEHNFNQICIAKIRWSDFLKNGIMGHNKLFACLDLEMCSIKNLTPKKEKDTDLLSKLAVSSLDERYERLKNYLKENVAKVLRIDKIDLRDDTDLIQMGMDSLIFLELSHTLSKELQVKVSPHKLFSEPTIDALAKNFAQVLGNRNTPDLDNDLLNNFPVHSDIENRFRPFELSDVQQAYWVGRQGIMGMGKTACHTYYELDVSDLNIERYIQAWNKLIKRHEMLRAVILPDGRQRILKSVPELRIKVSNFTQKNKETVETHLLAIRKRMSHQVFLTEEWPLFEVCVSQLNYNISRIHMSLDLLFADAHSIRLILHELQKFYQNPRQLPDSLSISFRDYIIGESLFRKSVLYKKAKAYWIDRLETLPKCPDLPVIKQLEDIDNPLFKRRIFTIQSDNWQALKNFALLSSITPTGLLLTAYARILSRWSKSSRFSINMTVFNRLPVHPQINEIVGDFTSVNFLEIDDSSNASFEEFAVQIQNQLWQDLEHRFFSGVKFLRELAQSKNAASMEIMPVVFTSNLSNADIKTKNIFSLTENSVYGISQTPQVWMDLQVAESDGKLVVFLDAVDDLFPKRMLDDMFSAYAKLLEDLSENKALWKQTRSHLLPEYQIKKREEVNATRSKISESMLHELFEKQAAAYPNHVAVKTSKSSITYERLSRSSDNLAYLLHNRGAKQNELIAVVMEKGWEQVVAVLGVLKSGAAYLPISPDIPPERLLHLLKHGEVKLVLTQSWLDQKLCWPDNVNIFSVDTQTYQNDLSVRINQRPDNLAYVIYTSGSTGLPKGVMVDHKGAVNTILDINKRFQISSEDSILALSNLNFDLSVYDIFGILAAGGTIVLPDESLRKEPAHWIELIKKESITLWNSVPQLMQMLIDYTPKTPLTSKSSLRVVLLSGDWIPLNLPQNICARFPQAQTISLGGATEASIWSILYPVQKIDPKWKSIPYGRPMENQHVYVLNHFFEDSPDWVPGLLYIAGRGLARGYWRNEDKTNTSFIRHPRTQERLYRTGDLGRYLPDGNIEFLGREDFQVKIRGHRIELGEIEAALKQHPDVHEAVVITTTGDDRGNKRLLSYIVLNKKKTLADYESKKLRSGTIIQGSKQPAEGRVRLPGAVKIKKSMMKQEALTIFLKQKLPDYMLPSSIIIIDRIPLTSNGKIDRKALPVPEQVETKRGKNFISPRTQMEVLLAHIWVEIFNINHINIFDNFFELGGDSLLAVRFVSKVRQELQVELTLKELYTYSNLAELSEFIEKKQKKRNALDQLPELVPDFENRHQPFPLTDIQQAYWVGRSGDFELGNVATHLYFEIESKHLNLERLNRAWQRVVDRHEMLRAIILPDGQQKILKQVPDYHFRVMDLHDQAPSTIPTELKAVRHEMSHQILPAEKWPLFDIRASQLPDGWIRLHVSLDALIADAWSFLSFTNDWYTIYRNPETKLAPIDVSFRDYVLAEISLQDSELYRRAKRYWSNRLLDLPPAPELPLGVEPASIKQPRFCRRSFTLPMKAWQTLKNRAIQNHLTPSGLLITAYTDVLGVWSKSPRFTINLTLFNRLSLHPQVNSIVGDFTTTILLGVESVEKEGFAARASQLQQQLWQDMDHRHFSGIKLLRELARRRGDFKSSVMPVVFTSALNLESMDSNVSGADNLGELVYGVSQTPQVWLDHQVYEQNGELILTWDAVEELFPKGMLDDMFTAYCSFLQKLAEEEETWQKTTRDLIPAAQLKKRIAANATEAPISPEMLHTLFRIQVSQQPDHTAVISSNIRLSYKELAEYSNHIGRLLQEKGAEPNRLIAILMEKGWEQITATLGILNSGAAYLPIDPELPEERIRHILADGEIKLALTQSWIAAKFKFNWPKDVQCFSVDTITLLNKDITPLDPLQKPEDLAYVIYTSGSTGFPKGVMIDHRGAVNTILDINQRFEVSSKDKILAISKLHFDLSVYDIFGTLAAGGSIVLPDPDKAREPAHWFDLMTDHQITIWNSVPALMQMFEEYLSSITTAVPQTLRLALLSGDWIPVDLPDKLKAYFSEIRIIGLGGATEASIWSNLYPIEEVNPKWISIPYGYPMLNQRYHVLNELMENCPNWVPGQLYIGGLGLAKGYWRDEEKTNNSFVVYSQTGERLYRTGDFGRYLPDGNIEFLGREDFQVKINGHRIECGEVETTLKHLPGVKDAVVIATDGINSKEKQLVGYVVPNYEKGSVLFETRQANPSGCALRWESIRKAGQKLASQIPGSMDLEAILTLMNFAEHLSFAIICQILHGIGIFTKKREEYTIEELIHQFKIQPRFLTLLRHWMNILVEESVVEKTITGRYLNHESLISQNTQLPSESPKTLMELYASLQYQIPLYIDLLQGNIDPVEVLLSKDSFLTAERLEQISPDQEYYFNLSIELFRTIIDSFPLNKKLKILEIGTRAGNLTGTILSLLSPDRATYLYADESCIFTNKLKEDLGDVPPLVLGLLDMNKPPKEQGYEPYSFDVIIADKTLHRANHLDKTLKYVKELLTPGGLLFLLEPTQNNRLILITIGFLEDGFTHFKDERKTKYLPFIPAKKWQNLLGNAGFSKTEIFPETNHAAAALQKHLIVAQAPETVRVFDSSKVVTALRQKLPDYMVPTRFRLLDRLPLSGNLKIDRNALIKLSQNTKPISLKKYVSPITEVQIKIVGVWGEMLSSSKVGIHDNFFELGGDSLRAIQFINLLRKVYRVEFSLREFFEEPNIEQLAKKIEEKLSLAKKLEMEEGEI